jgi:hypothetical protein
MLSSSHIESHLSLIHIELCLTALSCVIAFGWPQLCHFIYCPVERISGRLAHRKCLAVVSVGLSVLVIRLALLPIFPVPIPFTPDDFSFLLAADTFLHRRLTNPTPAMWTHFESLHLTMQPTYMSMYFPGEGLVLALGKILFGHPWFGILCTSALMCAAICWMLQAWLPPTWALLGGAIAVLRLGLFSYWVNTYTGAGTISAFGGALILGALPRFVRNAQLRNGLLLASGVILLAVTRPYEGLLLCLPVTVYLGRWLYVEKNRPPAAVLSRCVAAPLVLVIAAGAWMGYYDYRAFKNPLTLPYTVDRATYAVAPYYVWQSRRPAPVYRHEALRIFYYDFEPEELKNIQTPLAFIIETLNKAKLGILFFSGVALLPPLIMIRRVCLDRRIRFLVLCVLVLMAGMAIEIYLIPHYLAPYTAVFYAIGLQAMRHLRLWKPDGRSAGRALVRIMVTLCFALAGLRLYANPLRLTAPEWPVGLWVWQWYGPDHSGMERARIAERLEQLPEKQLAIVRYSPQHYPLNEWVYNAADIDGAKVIWAREMDVANNQELIHYYHTRKVWLVQPDTQPASISPYPISELQGSTSP